MMNIVNLFVFLVSFCMVTHANWISEKNDHDVIDQDDGYWYVKIKNHKVNRPAFTSYIRFYNEHTAKSVYEIDCSRSSKILYYNSPPQIIFLTTPHLWTIGDPHFITFDEGVFFSDHLENSTAYKNPKFWRFNVIHPIY